jgi:hypothetical protein
VVWDVMDVKRLLNPEKKPCFPVGTARIHQMLGICTKSVQPMYKNMMDPTSPLHWMIRQNPNGQVFVQTKFTDDDRMWSNAFHPWTSCAPRPQNRAFDAKQSGLLPTDLVLAESRVCAEHRWSEVTAAVDKARPRLQTASINAEEELAIDDMLERLRTQRPSQPITEVNLGCFNADLVDENDEPLLGDDEGGEHVYFRPLTMFNSTSLAAAERVKRRRQGHASRPLELSKFVAYTVDYTATVPKDKQNDFWVGQICNWDVETSKVHVVRYHTNTFKNSTGRAKYGKWRGGSTDESTEWITIDRVLEIMDLTETTRTIKASDRRNIVTALQVVETDRNQELLVGMGKDFLQPCAESEDDPDEAVDLTTPRRKKRKTT